MSVFDSVNKHVKLKNVHRDTKSFEVTTRKTKVKYKLAGNPLRDLDQFPFFVLSGSHPGAYHGSTSIDIKETEWINRNPKYPSRLRGPSRIDVTRFEILSTYQVVHKILDKKNRFKCIAELPESKYRKLKEGLKKIRTLHRPVSVELQNLLVKALEPLAEDIRRKLGI